MKNKLFIIISILVTLLFYYLIYDYQRSEIDDLHFKLNDINGKLDFILSSEDVSISSVISNQNSETVSSGVNYKENNLIKDKIINFADSLNKLLEDDISEGLLTFQEKAVDTLCYELSEQYKIINFYQNKIRIKNILRPGSILMSINDTISYKSSTYILKETNGKESYIKLYNEADQSDCKFHKVNP